MTRMVLKVGGNELDDPAFVTELVQAVAALPEPPVLVHGGGKEISQLGLDLGLVATFVGGMRVTDAPMLRLAVMVMAGLANKRLVAAFQGAGVRAVGVSGVDLGMLQVSRWQQAGGDLGFVGHVDAVDTDSLHSLLDLGVVILSPISADTVGQLYNVNADHVAQAVARALRAEALVFVTNVPGVLRDGETLPHLTRADIDRLIKGGVIAGGMVAKVRAALDAIGDGVDRVRIVNLAGLADGGTAITEV